KMGAGSVAFAMPRIVHGVTNAGNTKATYYLLKYKGKLPMDIERAKRAGGSFMLDWNDLATTNTGKGYRRDFFNRPTSQLGQFEIWGWATKGEKVTIRFNNKNFKAIAAADGKWFVLLPATKAGGPYTMNITGRNKIILKDILIGDVWICSGQSNMVHQMSLHNITYADDIA